MDLHGGNLFKGGPEGATFRCLLSKVNLGNILGDDRSLFQTHKRTTLTKSPVDSTTKFDYRANQHWVVCASGGEAGVLFKNLDIPKFRQFVSKLVRN